MFSLFLKFKMPGVSSGRVSDKKLITKILADNFVIHMEHATVEIPTLAFFAYL